MVSYHARLVAQIGPEYALFIGDSIVQGLCVACVTNRAVNLGIGGDTTLGAIARIQQYTTMASARVVVLAIGVNDLLERPPADIAPHYRSLLRAVPPHVPLIASSVLPIDEAIAERGHRTNNNIAKLNGYIMRECRALQNCIFQNNSEYMRNGDSGLARTHHIGDGVHLSSRGYELFIDFLKMRIERTTRD